MRPFTILMLTCLTTISVAQVTETITEVQSNSDGICFDRTKIQSSGPMSDDKIYQESSTGSLVLYQNPAQEELFMQLRDIRSVSMTEAKVITTLGQIIKEYKIDNRNSTTLEIDELPAGQSYLVVVETKDGSTFIEKFTKG